MKQSALKLVIRYAAVFAGFFVMSNGYVFVVDAGLGVNPWNVLHLGITAQTGLTLGRVVQLVGIALIAISYIFKVKPNVGTILNMYFVGLFIDLIDNLGYVPKPDILWQQVLLYLAGVALVGFGTALYISGNLGAGPRDSMMLALTNFTKHRAGVIRTVMEVTVTVAGYFLGGPVGLGTLVFAFFVGLFMEVGFSAVRFVKSLVQPPRASETC